MCAFGLLSWLVKADMDRPRLSVKRRDKCRCIHLRWPRLLLARGRPLKLDPATGLFNLPHSHSAFERTKARTALIFAASPAAFWCGNIVPANGARGDLVHVTYSLTRVAGGPQPTDSALVPGGWLLICCFAIAEGLNTTMRRGLISTSMPVLDRTKLNGWLPFAPPNHTPL